MAYFTETVAFGGMERYILALVDGLDRTVYEPILYCTLREETRPFLEEMAARGVEIHTTLDPDTDSRDAAVRARESLSILRRAWRTVPATGLKKLLWFWRRTKAAARMLHGQEIDVIHFHAGNLEAILPAMAAAAELRIPRRLLTMNNLFALRTRGHLVGHLHGRALRSTHAVIAISEAVRQCCMNGLRFPSDRVALIHHGIAPRPLPSWAALDQLRREAGLPLDGPVVGTVARLSPEKALHVLLEAMVPVKAAVPRARCLIVGDGPSRESLQRLTARLGLEGVVRFAGYRHDGATLIPLFDLAVLPSTNEGLSLFVLEAMAAGKPVVASRVGGIPEIVSDGETGLLVSAGDPIGLSAALLKLLRDPELARRMGETGRRRARAEFTLDAMRDQTLALYDGGLPIPVPRAASQTAQPMETSHGHESSTPLPRAGAT